MNPPKTRGTATALAATRETLPMSASPIEPGTIVGNVALRMRPDRLLIAGAPLGSLNGYPSLDVARTELAKLTQGTLPAAVVFAQEGVFLANTLKSVPVVGGIVFPGMSTPKPYEIRGRETKYQFSDNVAALVDGGLFVPKQT
jgi:hypothetical protein